MRGVSLTGSVRAGRSVGALAGKYLKKSVLELGGSDAYVVFADANIEQAAKICAQARMVNNGQSCVAAKRFVVHESIEKNFLTALIAELEKYVPGDPKNIATKVSCLAGRDFKKHLFDQCAMLEKNGAKLIWNLGNQTNIDPNHPTIFAARIYTVDKVNQEIANQELFGPVVILHNFSSEDQAVSLVNSSCFGLGAAVFSEDCEKAKRFALRLEAGIVGINSQVKSDVRYPFGGVKDSGYGRELGSVGFDEFVSHRVLINPEEI